MFPKRHGQPQHAVALFNMMCPQHTVASACCVSLTGQGQALAFRSQKTEGRGGGQEEGGWGRRVRQGGWEEEGGVGGEGRQGLRDHLSALQ